MAEVKDITVTLRFRGDYNTGQSYSAGDVVRAGKQFAIAIKPSKGKRPVEGNDWTMLGGGAAAMMGGGRGRPGVGVPSGGTTGQVLAKKSNTAFATEWVDNVGGSGLSQQQVLARQTCF